MSSYRFYPDSKASDERRLLTNFKKKRNKGRRKSKEKNKKALIDQSRYMVWSFVHHHSD
jgi:hypothetical protein